MKKQVEDWLHFAEVDLVTVDRIHHDSFLVQSAAFHCHQAVEKTLKALISQKDQRVPKTHDLVALYGIVEQLQLTIGVSSDALDSLNQVYIDTRYPSDFGLLPGGLPSGEDIQSFYSLAKDLFEQAWHVVQ